MLPGGTMSGIFISYRRDDSAASAGRIYDVLCNHFGSHRVFLDRSSIPPGSDFILQILDRVASAEAMVVVIGERWLTSATADGKPRLEDPQDVVRQEVAAGLQRGIPLFPVLVSGARLPAADDLPPGLRGLCRFNALDVTERSFPSDLDCLLEAMSASLAAPVAKLPQPRLEKKKVCMVGSFAVGKTSLVRRFVESIFDERYHTTIGVKVDKKVVAVGPRRLQIMLWDLAGEDEATPIQLSYLRGAAGYILVADGLRIGTLDKSRELRRRVEDAAGPLPFVLAINKSDRRNEWQVDDHTIHELSNSWVVFETSAKTGQGVEELFRELAIRLLAEGGSE
jgi:small GTP-binding protein